VYIHDFFVVIYSSLLISMYANFCYILSDRVYLVSFNLCTYFNFLGVKSRCSLVAITGGSDSRIICTQNRPYVTGH